VHEDLNGEQMTAFDIQRCVQIAERTILLPDAVLALIEELPQIRYAASGDDTEPSGYYVPIEQVEAVIAAALADQRAMIAQSLGQINPTIEENIQAAVLAEAQWWALHSGASASKRLADMQRDRMAGLEQSIREINPTVSGATSAAKEKIDGND
jgi:hypothetical protein